MNASGDSERDRRIYDRGAQRNIWFDFAANDGTGWQIDSILHASKGQKGRMSDGRGKKYLLVCRNALTERASRSRAWLENFGEIAHDSDATDSDS